MKQVIIEINDGTIIVTVDGQRMDFMQSDELSQDQIDKISRQMFLVDQRMVSRSIFKV